MKPVEAIFFDLDSTLVYVDSAVLDERLTRVCAALAAAYPGLDPARLRSHCDLVGPELWPLTVLGRFDGLTTMREVWRRALVACGCEAEGAADTAHNLFWRHRQGIIRPFDDVAVLLQQLQGRFSMAVITNGPQDTQLDKLDVVGFGGYFELFVASGMHRVVKPDPALFKIALDRLGVAPESTWHIGDSLSADVAGAKAAGLGAAVWLNRNGAVRTPEEPEPDLEIASLTELLDHLA